jgi:hypothetical protein
VAGIDRAGNYGTPGQVAVPVSAPPDYVLQLEQAPVWSVLSNAAVSDDRLYLPVSASETWETHFTSRGWTSPQDQINAGYPLYIQPGESSGYAEAVIDAGSTLPSSKITITASLGAITGSPSAAYTISVSNSSASGPWTDYAGSQAYATAFRWAKVKIAVTGGIAEVFTPSCGWTSRSEPTAERPRSAPGIPAVPRSTSRCHSSQSSRSRSRQRPLRPGLRSTTLPGAPTPPRSRPCSTTPPATA